MRNVGEKTDRCTDGIKGSLNWSNKMLKVKKVEES